MFSSYNSSEIQKRKGFQEHLGLFDQHDFLPFYLLDSGNLVTQTNRCTEGMMRMANQSKVSDTSSSPSPCCPIAAWFCTTARPLSGRVGTAGSATDSYLIRGDEGNALVYGEGMHANKFMRSSK
ncbi:hypothetical protein AXG93_2164s1010 [Marchantia polymorpha subsp. ruderalis]|uniref:Uncharacterized protein n=1 Tax=Marchantia polymorpha subsp. ruderalis TaxID=1480154 RepID=A0A176VHB1_MARPO|nr:hypothetical protein AXG93_2164s1010 [Marchantia polymorpha subsp. ruderalis]